MKKRPLNFLGFSLSALLLSTFVMMVADIAVAGSKFRPPRSGAPGNREAGAARSDTCASTANSSGLTALLPTSNLGLTTKAFPTFFAYLPPNNAQRAEFRLVEEESGKEVFTGQVQMPKANAANAAYRHKASVVKMSLPKTGSSEGLKAGKSYLWAMMLVCNAQNRAEDIVVTGVVQRVDDNYVKTLDAETKQKLASVNTVPPQEKPSIYGSAGIWNDMLADTAALMQKNPATYSEEWKDLLGEQGLGAIATAPVVEVKLEPIRP
ncbi:MAG TPA: DUF928 domain-containing protein [Leptolyngbyaceae cyanobacterium M33_DOE_097]|uniref:DUF928 domain-containing protein n=1 Tax=Oscillatoriales cyanobacterium SpSt-418 TaxID=2282169 RepID=A0A7C3KCF8_9CYAN|nr:DUF928 domain-containing protein [Leptolyngbyaceae cyanobacterium M33_DOE_097]